jgi:lipopolysaccharide transport system ATP-binding protein
VYARPQQRLRRLLTGAAAPQQHWSLRDVSFNLHQGQCLGVIGDNGAGKSTLLKLLAGSLQPSQGQVLRAGRLTASLELGAGFHPEFTGRDNLHFAGGFMGFSAADMRRLTPSILDFAELGEAIDRPLKTYSSGMVVRLAFALVTAVQPEVLIIDEALAVGDQHFQKKCVERTCGSCVTRSSGWTKAVSKRGGPWTKSSPPTKPMCACKTPTCRQLRLCNTARLRVQSTTRAILKRKTR